MAKDYHQEVIDALHDLDNEAFNEDPCTIVFFSGFNDNRGRFVDVTMVKGHAIIENRNNHKDLYELIGADDLIDAIKQLAKEINQ